MVIDTVIADGTIVTANGMFDGAVAIDDGRIVAVGEPESLSGAREFVDATGKLVMPGAVDPHVHIDYIAGDRVGTYPTETVAAALGGVTTIIDFAWPGGQLRSDGTVREGIEYKRKKGEAAVVDYGLHCAVTAEKPELLEELPSAVEAGITSFKMFMAPKRVAVSHGFMYDVFERVAELDAVAMVHNEDPSVCEYRSDSLRKRNRGEPTAYPESRPDYAEAIATETSLRLAAETGVKYYSVHTTCRAAIDVIERFRAEGHPVRAETCTHYTTLDASVHERLGCLPQIAPPLRSTDDIAAVFDGLREGTLDVVATDHVVFERSRKTADRWWDASLGANSVQRSLPVFYDEAVNRRGFSPSFVVRVMCTAPARIFGLPTKGTLQPGTDADIVVFDPAVEDTVTAEENASNADFSIYEGRTVTGQVETVFLRGEQIVEDGECIGDAGTGKFIQRSVPEFDEIDSVR